MRADFQHQLDSLRADTGGMCELAGDAMENATRGLLGADAEVARYVLTDVQRLKFLHHDVERRTLAILARQAPVAGDLRTVVSAIHIAANANRMGGLASHIAKLTLRRHPESVMPRELNDTFARMGRIAAMLAENCHVILTTGDCARAQQVQHDDHTMEAIHQELFRAVTDPAWGHGPSVASDVVLLGRFYGRFADHADEIARRMIFQTSGDPVRRRRAG
ncbi:phosphate signaling complex PhoU family protein [Mycolicibacterium hodleri]|uniref:Phosphate transport system regulatory protein PhoU n=1 Tax=Mycolicibacterium hodleri TaxID=49897 RepID=A0A502DJZ5_9MYCO|nr:PhoU domain-containing protein [Mycolicibacterium hodleri]TPG25628.1 phosphate transport system regulatory protein PhoU [Mycolicibacterium hodleri]